MTRPGSGSRAARRANLERTAGRGAGRGVARPRPRTDHAQRNAENSVAHVSRAPHQ